MRYSGTWLTPEDEAILEHLEQHGPAKVDELHEREVIDYSRSYLAERCTTLAGRGRLLAFADGGYRLTGRGEDYLNGELDPAGLTVDERD